MMSQYDGYINVSYSIVNMTAADIVRWTEKKQFDALMIDLAMMIERSYVNHQGSGWALNYYDFYIGVHSMNGYDVSTLSAQPRPDGMLINGADCDADEAVACDVNLECTLFCDDLICHYINQKYDTQQFESYMTDAFDQYLHPASKVIHQFKVVNMSAPLLMNPATVAPVDAAPVDAADSNGYVSMVTMIMAIVLILTCCFGAYFCVRYKQMKKKMKEDTENLKAVVEKDAKHVETASQQIDTMMMEMAEA